MLKNKILPTCVLAFGFLVAHLYTMTFTKQSPLQQSYLNSLSEDQRQIYGQIVTERRETYLQGLALGTLLAGLVLVLSPLKGNQQVCVFVLTIMGTAFFYYLLKPKSHNLMVTYLNQERQRLLWQEVYQEYQSRYYSGFLLGILAFILIGRIFA